uniref:Uncharacterized protein n=1 Tax=Oryzias latipes TaxID=8090 RepID=A0A3B3I2M2_ORYLA
MTHSRSCSPKTSVPSSGAGCCGGHWRGRARSSSDTAGNCGTAGTGTGNPSCSHSDSKNTRPGGRLGDQTQEKFGCLKCRSTGVMERQRVWMERQRVWMERQRVWMERQPSRELSWVEREQRARRFYQQQLQERKKKLLEQRLKEERRRAAVEEKRRQKLKEDKERYESAVRKTLEKSQKARHPPDQDWRGRKSKKYGKGTRRCPALSDLLPQLPSKRCLISIKFSISPNDHMGKELGERLFCPPAR